MSKFITLIENKAFIIALLTAAASTAAVFGYNIPVQTIVGLITPIMVILGVQGWQTAQQTKLKMAHAHEVEMHALLYGHTVENGVFRDAAGKSIPAAPRAPQSGRARVGLLLIVATALLLIVQLARNSSTPAPTLDTADVVEGVALGPTGCASAPPIVTDIVDCVKAEAIVVSDGYTVTQVVAAVWGAIAGVVSDGITAVIPVLEGLATSFGPNLVACIVDDYPTSGSGAGSGSGSAAPVVASTRYGGAVDLDTKAKLLNALAPGKKFNHGKKK
jgi:hypothetical protein